MMGAQAVAAYIASEMPRINGIRVWKRDGWYWKVAPGTLINRCVEDRPFVGERLAAESGC